MLTVTNSGASPVTYALSNNSSLAEDPFGGSYPYTFGTYFMGNVIRYTVDGAAASTVTVPAGGTRTVSVSIQPFPDYWDDTAIWGGFLALIPTSGSTQTLRVPYAGFIGDYQTTITPIGGGGCGLPTLAQLGSATDTITCDTGQAPLTGFTAARTGGAWSKNDPVVLLWHLDHQVQNLTVTLIDAATNQPASQGGRNPVLYNVSGVARNSTAVAFGGFIWDGRIAFTDNGNGKVHSKATPAGSYKLLVTATKVKSFTDTRANQTQTWTSPAFTFGG